MQNTTNTYDSTSTTSQTVIKGLKHNLNCQMNTEKNVDRVRFSKVNNNQIYSACYQLDKGLKSGLIYNHSITNTTFVENYKIDLKDYGILDFRLNKTEKLLFSGNSNNSISIFNLSDNSITPKTNFEFKNTGSGDNINNTTNIIDYNEDSCSSLVLCGMNDGYMHLFDLEKEQVVSTNKNHEFAIWSGLIYDENIVLTGADDSFIKLFDRRSNKIENSLNFHKFGVTCFVKDDSNPYQIISGSYDEHIILWDIRNPKPYFSKKKIGYTVWDIKQNNYKNKNLLLVACIYDGFRIYENNFSEEGSSINEILFFEEHNSIVYGIDTRFVKNDNNETSLNIISCSFYDNLVINWTI